MFDRFERSLKIICLAMAALLAWQLGSLILRSDPLAHLKIPALPALPRTTNEPAKPAQKETKAALPKNTGTNGTNAIIGANTANGTNVDKGTNLPAKSTNVSALGEAGQMNAISGPRSGGARRSGRRGMSPAMMGGMEKIELPPEVQVRVDKIIDSEILGPAIRPMPVALIGISDQEAFIQATNGQTGPVKLGGEMAGIKLLRIGVNRVLVEQDGEKKELTLFGGMGGESLMPKPTNAPSTNARSTNMPTTNAPTRKASARLATANNTSTNQILSAKQKETQ
jgi:hypothetical protein